MEKQPGFTPNPFEQRPESQESTAYKRELARRSQDEIRVYNPTEEDYPVIWDGRLFPVPASIKDTGLGAGQGILLRYMADKYVREMLVNLRNVYVAKTVKEENDRRINSGHATMTIFDGGEEDRFTQRLLTTQVRDLENKWIRILWVGVEKEFGLDTLATKEAAQPVREPSLTDKLAALDNLDAPAKMDDPASQKKSVETPMQPDSKVDPKISKGIREDIKANEKSAGLGDKSVFELQKMARESKVQYEKTDKKDELLRKLSAAVVPQA